MEKNVVSKEYQEESCLLEPVSPPVVPKKPWTLKTMMIAALTGSMLSAKIADILRCVALWRRTCMLYVPATSTQISNIMKALKGRTGTVLDVGSGDGRVVIEASRHGFMGHGVELKSSLFLYSCYNAWRQGQRPSTKFYKKNLWKTDFSKYDNIIINAAAREEVMMDMEQKFKQEIRPTSRVITSPFPLPNWTPVKIIGEGLDKVWVYKHPDHQDS